MTINDYKEYQDAVARFFIREGITNLSAISDSDGTIEPSFSWEPCDCCGSNLGGDRYQCDSWNPESKEIQVYNNICPDCVYYAEYGQLDDMTMLEITA